MRLLRSSTLVVLLGVPVALVDCSGGGGTGPSPIGTASPVSSSPTPTANPGATATPTSSATSTPTPKPTATPTSAPTSTPTPSSGAFTPDDWPQFDHDSARTGVSNEVTGTHGAIALNKLWAINLGDVADSAPIVKGSLLFVTTHNGTTYGISTATGAKVWTFTTSGPNITTSEPAYDVSTGKLYTGGVDGRIHRLNPATGAEDTSGGFPALVTLATQTEKDASPLNIANGYVYAQTSGYDGDGTPYVGHVVAINTTSGQSRVFNTLCSSQTGLIAPQSCSEQRSGMWSRSGVVIDPDAALAGRAYVATGNGTNNPSGGDYGDAVLSLAPDASSLVGTFAPTNAAMLDADDLDLGSTSPVLLPRQAGSSTPLLVVQGGKDSMLRLLDRSNLGGANALLQTIQLNHGLYSAPAVYLTPTGQTNVYVGLPSGVFAYQLSTLGGTPQLVSLWNASVSLGGSGTSPIVRDGVVYVAATNKLVALDATTGATLGSNTSLGSVHWESPIVANGVVYCSDNNDNVTAFTIVPPMSPASRVRAHQFEREPSSVTPSSNAVERPPVLVAFAGLPGVGKTTLAEALARSLRCALVRVDAIEDAMLRAGIADGQPTGLAAYVAAEAIAAATLRARSSVIVDAVNAVEPARRSWIEIAERNDADCRFIEVECSDRDEHRARVTRRAPSLERLRLPTWTDVATRAAAYDAWTFPRLAIDSTNPTSESLAKILAHLAGAAPNRQEGGLL